jgi:hypothetical protein
MPYSSPSEATKTRPRSGGLGGEHLGQVQQHADAGGVVVGALHRARRLVEVRHQHDLLGLGAGQLAHHVLHRHHAAVVDGLPAVDAAGQAERRELASSGRRGVVGHAAGAVRERERELGDQLERALAREGDRRRVDADVGDGARAAPAGTPPPGHAERLLHVAERGRHDQVDRRGGEGGELRPVVRGGFVDRHANRGRVGVRSRPMQPARRIGAGLGSNAARTPTSSSTSSWCSASSWRAS